MAPGVLVSPVQPSFGPGYNVAAGMNSAPSLAQAGGQSPANATFLTTFTSQIRPRLTQVLAHFGGQDVAKNLVLAQVRPFIFKFVLLCSTQNVAASISHIPFVPTADMDLSPSPY